MSMADRLLGKCIPEPNSGCWLWFGATNPKGYGNVAVKGRTVGAHRLSYEEFVGPIPDGLDLDHLCRMPCCINPAHLEPVTRRENVIRGNVPKVCGAHELAKTHCPSGHEYTEENTRRYRGSRYCKECNRARLRADDARKRQERFQCQS